MKGRRPRNLLVRPGNWELRHTIPALVKGQEVC